jgi:outer membrane protein OmpA-like peptidoglycan-associated protein
MRGTLHAIIMKHRGFPALFFERNRASERGNISWIIRACATILVFYLNHGRLYCQSSKDTTLVLYFKSAYYKLNRSQIEQIEKFENVVSDVKSIVGYADSIGTAAYNLKLSKMRAFDVYQIVIKRFKPMYPYSIKEKSLIKIQI